MQEIKRSKSNCWQHFVVLLWKNALTWRRTLGASLFELLSPIIFISLLAALRTIIDVEHYDEGNHYDKSFMLSTLPDAGSFNDTAVWSKTKPFFECVVADRMFRQDTAITTYAIIGNEGDPIP